MTKNTYLKILLHKCCHRPVIKKTLCYCILIKQNYIANLLKFMKSKDKEICTLDSDLFGVRHYYLLSVKVMWENV